MSYTGTDGRFGFRLLFDGRASEATINTQRETFLRAAAPVRYTRRRPTLVVRRLCPGRVHRFRFILHYVRRDRPRNASAEKLPVATTRRTIRTITRRDTLFPGAGHAAARAEGRRGVVARTTGIHRYSIFYNDIVLYYHYYYCYYYV